MDAADTPANATEFGVTQGGNLQLRLLALIKCGTHALIDVVFDGVRRAREQRLARRLLHALRPGMLLLADRNFPGYELWAMAAATGADLLWRIKSNNVFVVVKVLPDGSFPSVMPTPAENVRHGQARAAGKTLPTAPKGHLVRVIEYTIAINNAAGTTRIEPFRLITILLDHDQAPAAKLAAIYHQRWENENGYAELKTRLRGAAFVLRSKSPELLCQELFAFLTVYQALCALECEAAVQAGINPDRVSFTVTVRIARDHASSPTILTSAGLARARRQAISDLLADLLPQRRARQCDRVKKPPKKPLTPRNETKSDAPAKSPTRSNDPEEASTSANSLTHRHCSEL